MNENKVVRSKWQCQSVTKTKGWNGPEFMYGATFQVVTSGSEENKQFFASTPSGQLTIGVVSADYFVPGKFYYLDFQEADA